MHHLPSRYIPCDGRLTASTYFNPHSPHRERQSSSLLCVVLHYISIHAPRMGSDLLGGHKTTIGSNFNPRSPHGERPESPVIINPVVQFQSTLPAWGATTENIARAANLDISIHAPRMGSDSTVKAYSNDRIKRSTLREPHFLYSKNACFSPIFPLCATTLRTKNQRIIVSFGSYPGLAPTCFTLDRH